MTVFVVEIGEYSERGIASVFSTKDLAREYIEKCGQGDVTPWLVDEDSSVQKLMVGTCSISLDTGEITDLSESPSVAIPGFSDVSKPYQEWEHGQPIDKWWLTVHCDGGTVRAVKLATEARQAWLRERVPA
jgi:hypothetical protein